MGVCRKCIQGAGATEELKKVEEGSLYVQKSSRTIYERSKEHLAD